MKTRIAKRGYELVRPLAAAAAPEPDAPAEDAPGPGNAELLLYDIIGQDWLGEGITAKRVLEDLGALAGVDELHVRVNSPGGDVWEGIAIYNAIARFPARVVVHVDGLAASAASLIALAGDQVLVAENAMFMVHRAWTIAVGDAVDMRRVASMLDKVWTSLLTTYESRTGQRAATIDQRVTDGGGEWWMTAAEAKKAGFADQVEEPVRAELFGLEVFAHVPEQLAAAAATPRARRVSAPPAALPAIEAPRLVRRSAAEIGREQRQRQVAALAVS